MSIRSRFRDPLVTGAMCTLVTVGAVIGAYATQTPHVASTIVRGGDTGVGFPTPDQVTACQDGTSHEMTYNPQTDTWTCEVHAS